MAEIKYKIIADELLRRCRTGEIAGRFPPQRALKEEFGVSSRTLHKVFLLLKQQHCIAPSPRGTTVAAVPPEPPRRRRINVFVSASDDMSGDPLYTRLAEHIRSDGYEPALHFVVKPDMEALTGLDFLPGDGCIFIYSCFCMEYADWLRERSIPFVVGNRVAPEAGIHWVDWNHLELFDNILGELVARGAREIALFSSHTGAQHLPRNVAMIQQDFVTAKRGYFLFNRELDAMPQECNTDLNAYLGFLRSLRHRPDAVLCLSPTVRRHLIAGMTEAGDPCAESRVLLLNSAPDREPGNCVVGFYSDAGYRKIADKLWTLLRQVSANPGLKPCGLKQRCTIQYSRIFLKTKFLPTTERS